MYVGAAGEDVPVWRKWSGIEAPLVLENLEMTFWGFGMKPGSYIFVSNFYVMKDPLRFP